MRDGKDGDGGEKVSKKEVSRWSGRTEGQRNRKATERRESQ